jgi:hypothetical protein
MSVKDSAATPDAAQATWQVFEGIEGNTPNRSVEVDRTPGDGVRISGLPAGHYSAVVLGTYIMQAGSYARRVVTQGRPAYKGGRDGKQWMWYNAKREQWWVGNDCMFAKDQKQAATPDAVPAGKWSVIEGWQVDAAVKCTKAMLR